MYLALQPLRLRQPDCTVKAVEVGEEVKDFTNWPEWTQQAMLRQRQVRWAPEGLAPHESKQGERGVVQHMPRGMPPRDEPKPLSEDSGAMVKPATRPIPKMDTLVVDSEADSHPAALKPHPSKAKRGRKPLAKKVDAEQLEGEVVDAKAGETVYEKKAAAPIPGSERIKVDNEPPAKGAHDCPKCDRQGFADFNGLRIHMARAHKGE